MSLTHDTLLHQRAEFLFDCSHHISYLSIKTHP